MKFRKERQHHSEEEVDSPMGDIPPEIVSVSTVSSPRGGRGSYRSSCSSLSSNFSTSLSAQFGMIAIENSDDDGDEGREEVEVAAPTPSPPKKTTPAAETTVNVVKERLASATSTAPSDSSNIMDQLVGLMDQIHQREAIVGRREAQLARAEAQAAQKEALVLKQQLELKQREATASNKLVEAQEVIGQLKKRMGSLLQREMSVSERELSMSEPLLVFEDSESPEEEEEGETSLLKETRQSREDKAPHVAFIEREELSSVGDGLSTASTAVAATNSTTSSNPGIRVLMEAHSVPQILSHAQCMAGVRVQKFPNGKSFALGYQTKLSPRSIGCSRSVSKIELEPRCPDVLHEEQTKILLFYEIPRIASEQDDPHDRVRKVSLYMDRVDVDLATQSLVSAAEDEVSSMAPSIPSSLSTESLAESLPGTSPLLAAGMNIGFWMGGGAKKLTLQKQHLGVGTHERVVLQVDTNACMFNEPIQFGIQSSLVLAGGGDYQEEHLCRLKARFSNLRLIVTRGDNDHDYGYFTTGTTYQEKTKSVFC